MLTFARNSRGQNAKQNQSNSICEKRESRIDISLYREAGEENQNEGYTAPELKDALEVYDANESTDSKDCLTGAEHVGCCGVGDSRGYAALFGDVKDGE
jgi:hypothetical protein